MSEELTKINKDDLLIKLLKKINICIDDEPFSHSNEDSPDLNPLIDDIYIMMKINDESIQLKATQACRKILSRGENIPCDEMISKGIVSLCIEFLKPQYSSQLQFESCWTIINVAAGTSEQTQYVIKQGAIPLLVELLKSPSLNVAEQAVWALGNIAGDGPGARDLVLREGALRLLIQLITPETPVSFVRKIVWTLSNMCRHKNPAPPFETVKDALPLLNRLLNYPDKDVLGDTCWALSYLTDGPNEKIQAVIESGVVPKLIELLASPEVTVLTPALRTVCNIVTGNDSQTDTVVAHGGLRFIRDLMYHEKVDIIEKAVQVISNITAGNVDQIQNVIESDVITPLIQVMQKGDFDSQKEAARVIKNVTSEGTIFQIGHLVQIRVLKPLCDLMALKDWDSILVVLDCINNILSRSKKIGEADQIILMIKEVEGLEKLQALQKHENLDIQQKATSMINSYFSMAKDDKSTVPNTATNTEGHQIEFETVTPEGTNLKVILSFK